ncbi:hypothetical protein ACWF5H_02860 [Arthrobacter sp. NPDC055138]
MTQSKIVFTLTASPHIGDERVFRNSIELMVEDGVGGASFTPADIGRTQAVLQGGIIADRRLVTARGLAEYLADTLASKEGIRLALGVELGDRSVGERLRAA